MSTELTDSIGMSDQSKYWRDASVKLLGWGTTILAGIALIAFNDSQKYELIWPLHPRDRYRAIVLLIFVFVYGVAWFLGSRWIYKRHLTTNIDSTVLPWRVVQIYLLVVILSMWLLALATTLRSRPPQPEPMKICHSEISFSTRGSLLLLPDTAQPVTRAA